MDLYLIRHAEAKLLGEENIHDDADRPLTEKGHHQAKIVGARLQARGIKFAALVTSPLLRARQTAEGVIGAMDKPAPELLTSEEVAPKGKRRKLGKFLREQTGEALAVVGHVPHLNQFAGWLIGSKSANIDIVKGGVAFIRCPEGPKKGAGTLAWLIGPDWME